MRKWMVIAGIVLQVGVLAYMVYGKESVIRSGKRIFLATAPIDPRDPFRGDYVRLQYPLNSFSSAPNQWSKNDAPPKRDDIVYVVLQPTTGDLYDVAHFTDVQPKDGVFMRGRRNSGGFWFGGNSQDVRYGIEQVFVEQGRGIDIENKRGVRGGMQTAMEVQVALDKKGTAVLVDYRWSQLAMQLELTERFQLVTPQSGEETSNTNSSDSQDSGPQMIVTIKNVSDETLTLNNPDDDCGFQLVPANRVDSRFREANNSCTEGAALSPLVLAPGQEYQLNIHLDNPRWFVEFANGGEAVTGDVRTFTGNREFFRIAYLSGKHPAATASDGYWEGNLISQAFNPQGRID